MIPVNAADCRSVSPVMTRTTLIHGCGSVVVVCWTTTSMAEAVGRTHAKQAAGLPGTLVFLCRLHPITPLRPAAGRLYAIG